MNSFSEWTMGKKNQKSARCFSTLSWIFLLEISEFSCKLLDALGQLKHEVPRVRKQCAKPSLLIENNWKKKTLTARTVLCLIGPLVDFLQLICLCISVTIYSCYTYIGFEFWKYFDILDVWLHCMVSGSHPAPLCEWVCRRSAKFGLQAHTRPGGGFFLAVKSAKPCTPFRSDPHAALLQTRCPFSEHAVHVAGGRDEGGVRGREGAVRCNRNTNTSSYYLVK